MKRQVLEPLCFTPRPPGDGLLTVDTPLGILRLALFSGGGTSRSFTVWLLNGRPPGPPTFAGDA